MCVRPGIPSSMSIWMIAWANEDIHDYIHAHGCFESSDRQAIVAPRDHAITSNDRGIDRVGYSIKKW